MKHLCILLVRFYRKCISPFKPPCCRYYPTCSSYAIEAFQKRGFFVGLALTVRRILRCNPFGGAGYDPVPPRWPKVDPRRRNRNEMPGKKENVT